MVFAKTMVSEYTEKAANAAEGSAEQRGHATFARHFAKQVEEYEERERIFARAEAMKQRLIDYSIYMIQCWWRDQCEIRKARKIVADLKLGLA
jgi:hypothetical protein